MPKKTKISLIVIVFLIIVSIIGFSYAYIAKKAVVGNRDNTLILDVVDYGKIYVNFENDNNQIEANFLELPEEEKGTDYYYMLKFNIESTANISEEVQIKWKDLDNTFCTNYGEVYSIYSNCYSASQFAEFAVEESMTVEQLLDYYAPENDPSSFYIDAREELTYALYSCTSTQYNNITTPDDTDISSCTKISNVTDQAVPENGSKFIHQNRTITIDPNSTNYYVLRIKLKNLTTDQSYQQGAHLNGTIGVNIYNETWLDTCTNNGTNLSCLIANLAVSDATNSTYVNSIKGIAFDEDSSLING